MPIFKFKKCNKGVIITKVFEKFADIHVCKGFIMINYNSDGKFVIKQGQGIAQGIQGELRLSDAECKQLESIWSIIIKELDNSENIKVTNNGNNKPDKSNNYLVQTGAIVEFSNECWQKITGLVSEKLGKNINTDKQAAEVSKNIINLSEDKFSEELKSWTLDDRYWYDNTEYKDLPPWIADCTVSVSAKAKDWYQEYKEKNGEMTFPDAVKYINDNPDLDFEVQEYIKQAFGICDGDVSNNKQGHLGTCHLLSCRDELGDNEELSEIVKNVVKQNDDGTVTVTFYGATDKNGKPLSYNFTNKEIAESIHYRGNDKGCSSDPDNAALEMGYIKLKEYALNLYNEFCKEKAPIEFEEEQEYLRLRSLYAENNSEKDEKYKQLSEYLKTNESALKTMGWNEMKVKLMQDNMLDAFIKCPYGEISEKLNELQNKYSELCNKYAICDNLRQFWSENEEIKKLGSYSDMTFRLLTGKDAKTIYEKEKIDNYLQESDYKTTPTVVGFKENNKELNLITNHAYSLEDVYTENGTKFIKIKNPHGYSVVLKYEDFLENVEDITYLNM